MIKIENVEVMGWEHAIRGMRNPKNSWDRSDTVRYAHDLDPEIGENDYKLMTALRDAGTDHRKFMRMITVYLDVTAPLYFYKEFDTYKVGTVANSCSTMHKIHDKEFELGDFSWEHLNPFSLAVLERVIQELNHGRDYFLESKDKKDWWQMIQLLPSSYNQKRTVMLNYEVLANMYKSRKSHKLDEWRCFCEWIKELPYSELIIGREEKV